MKTAKAVVLFAGAAVILFAASRAGSELQQITQPIDNSKLVVLRGNTHPLARPEFDRGPIARTQPVNEVMLLLKSTPEQGAELNELLAEQQDPGSANYHKWLSPEEFGSQFGTSQADIQKITAWLTSFGFTIDNVANGRNVIRFSGNAGQVEAAFHTSMHNYEIAGKRYVANANDPAIPVALTPAVAGIVSLNNFPRKPASRFTGAFYRDQTGKLKRAASRKATPEFTSATGCEGATGVPCYAVTPYDFATIYNILPLWNASINGSGETIGIVSDSDINTADFSNFRSSFGLPKGTLNVNHTNGDPGIQGPNCSDPWGCNETEADVDVQWSGAVAPGATIDLVVTNDQSITTFGGDISAESIIDNKTASVLGYSYGTCEFFLGTTGNQFYGGTAVKDTTGEWAQAAAEGITVVVSTGDTGATNCDGPANGSAPPCAANNFVEDQNGNEIPYNDPAVCGLAVNGIASTPYNVAVGGTDFNDPSNPTTYWSSTNASSTFASVVGYIPETTYNDSCTSVIVATEFSSSPSTDPITNCSNFAASGAPSTTFALSELVVPGGGGGGPSNCITSNFDVTTGTGSLTTCTAGYTKPSWQTALTPADGKRDLPDVSLFAGDGTVQNFYLYCEQDVTSVGCSMSAGSSSSPYPNILGIGGTSVSAEAFVGVIALLNQAEGSSGPVGLPNQNLYSLAGQSWANCAQASSGTLTSACIFNQVTNGTIEQPCSNTPNGAAADCNQPNGAAIGTTEINGEDGYDAAAGYNLATGLGSLNVYNLVKEWAVGSSGKADFVLSASPAAITISSAGGSGTTAITVVPVNGFTDSVSFASSACSGLPSGTTCSFSSSSVAPNTPTTLKIQTTASGAVPLAVHPDRFAAWRVPGILALGCAISVAIFFFSLSRKNRRWGLAIASIVFLAFVGIAGCGGGSSSSGGGGGGGGGGGTGAFGPQAVTITGTDTTTNTAHTTTVLLTVQ
jgi:Pro-kumamolisin, activation domain